MYIIIHYLLMYTNIIPNRNKPQRLVLLNLYEYFIGYLILNKCLKYLYVI